MRNEGISKKEIHRRLSSLDHFRGFALFLMILVNSLSPYNVPYWLKHAPWNGYQFPDLVAPMFLFAMGVAYRISLSRRISRFGLKRTALHFIKRYMILFLFGFVGILIVKKTFDWGILQMLGTVGLFAFPNMFLRSLYSILVSIILIIPYQISLNIFDLSNFVAKFDMGGPLATLSWCFILVFVVSFVGMEIFHGERHTVCKRLLLTGAALTLVGFATSFLVPLNKHLVSSSYVLFSTGLATILFSMFYILNEIYRIRIRFLESLGKNSLTIFIISSAISTFVELKLPSSVPVVFPVLIAVGLLAFCIVIAEFLARHEIYIKL